MDIIWKVCDEHRDVEHHDAQQYRILVENVNLPAEVTEHTLVDLCDEEAVRVLGPVLELLMKRGRAELGPAQRRTGQRGPYYCEPCGLGPWKTKQSKTEHDKKAHGGQSPPSLDRVGTGRSIIAVNGVTRPALNPAEPDAAPVLTLTCEEPGCGKQFTGKHASQARGAHGYHKHGRRAKAKAKAAA